MCIASVPCSIIKYPASKTEGWQGSVGKPCLLLLGTAHHVRMSPRSQIRSKMLPTHSTRKPRTTPATVIVFILLLLGLLAFCGYELKKSQSTVEDLRQQLATSQQAAEGAGVAIMPS